MSDSQTDRVSDGTSTSANRQTTSNNEGQTSKENVFVISKCQRNLNVTKPTLNQQETSDEIENDEKLLSIYCRGGKLGAAYYTLQSGELFILEEIVDRPPEYQVFLSLYRQVDPACLILDGKNQSAFIQLVKKTAFDSDANNEGRCRLVFLSMREYSFEACKRRIHSLSLPNEPPNCTEDERIVFLRTLIDFSQTQSVHALGALLRYLDMHWSSTNLGLQAKPQYLCLKIVSLKDIVTIDSDTYRGLQIFNTVAHPSNFKKGVQGSSKEGLSLYQLFSKCSSKVGHSKMRCVESPIEMYTMYYYLMNNEP
ncbi:hypothetical protein K1T71_002195 [Dendrolimus kikuchii]|uniref:Uncharacterized protein n=1 Tax=Dendrolimus kikuchii TaxID=765133 RepID=A0ACC1DG29_9NEOP|nr:hypothetical protein K1T71_002195 [Dendrolimus kikuchii]